MFVARSYSFSDVKVGSDSEIDLIELGEPLPIPDRAVIKLKDDATVYYLVDGVLRPLTLTAFRNRGLLFENVITLSAEEFAKYPVGALVAN